jgi:3-dehydroquinate synthase
VNECWLAEIIEIAVVRLWIFLAGLNDNLTRDHGVLPNWLTLSDAVAEIKAHVVGLDERETENFERLLNFGHTFGRRSGMGMATGYTGVGCGMVMAAELSKRLGLVDGIFSGLKDADRSFRFAGSYPPITLDTTDSAGRYCLSCRWTKSEAGEFGCGDRRSGRAAVRTASLVREVIDSCCSPMM